MSTVLDFLWWLREWGTQVDAMIYTIGVVVMAGIGAVAVAGVLVRAAWKLIH